MCHEVHINGECVDQVGPLRRHLPNLVAAPEYGGRQPRDSDCLCVLDIEATCRANGYHIARRYMVPQGEWHLVPQSRPGFLGRLDAFHSDMRRAGVTHPFTGGLSVEDAIDEVRGGDHP